MIMEEHNETLHDVSKRTTYKLLPVLIFLCVIMVLGVFGNVLAVIFYGFKTRVNATSRLILGVALIDALICITMPRTLADVSLTYRYSNTLLCKFDAFFNHLLVAASMLVLVALGAFRFRNICRPCSKRFSIKDANIALVGSIILVTVLCSPCLYVFEAVPVNVTYSAMNRTETLAGYYCGLSKRDNMALPTLLVTGAFFLLAGIALGVLLMLYGLIAKHIREHGKKARESGCRGRRDGFTFKSSPMVKQGSTSSIDKPVCDNAYMNVDSRKGRVSTFKSRFMFKQASNSSIDEVIYENTGTNRDNLDKDKPIYENVSRQTDGVLADIGEESERDTDGVYYANNNTIPRRVRRTTTGSVRRKSFYRHRRISVVAQRQTLMLFIITIVFIASLVPYFVKSIYEVLTSGHAIDDLWYQFCYRAYIINNAVNPIIYGFFNGDFRRFVSSSFCSCFRKTNVNMN